MALYLGSSKHLQIRLGGDPYNVNFFSTIIDIVSGKLLSSEGYILKDSNGLYLVPKEDN